MVDSLAVWNKKYAQHEMDFALQPMQFAQTLTGQIKPGDKLLELGCGVGGDAQLFASLGADVMATDFSEVVIAENQQRNTASNLRFQVRDISQPFPDADASFDIVYSHLALHYWNAEQTAAIFAEISRVLKPGGRLYFACKSTKDPFYGEGDLVEPDVFVRQGRYGASTRHFFTPAYVHILLEPAFTIDHLEEIIADYDGRTSAFVTVWATKQ